MQPIRVFFDRHWTGESAVGDGDQPPAALPRRFRVRTTLALCTVMTLQALPTRAQDTLIEGLMRARPDQFAEIQADPERYRVQVLYTRVRHGDDGAPRFESHGYRLGADDYFYPASTVKFPVAVFALEKLARLGLPRNARLTVMPDQGSLYGSVENGPRRIDRHVEDIFVVSDNAAYNRLYEFVGPDAIAARIAELELANTRIVHRLSSPATRAENRIANATELEVDGQTVHREPRRAGDGFDATPLPVGSSYVDRDGTIVGQPFDFGVKNEFPIAAQQRLLREVLFPTGALKLRDEDRVYLRRAMTTLPREARLSRWNPDDYPDTYVKYLLAGGEAELPDGITIYNKVGQAYGFTTDNAYIVDSRRGIGFFLAATIYTNANGRLNDDDYEYDAVAVPFLRDLGRAVYAYELEQAGQ